VNSVMALNTVSITRFSTKSNDNNDDNKKNALPGDYKKRFGAEEPLGDPKEVLDAYKKRGSVNTRRPRSAAQRMMVRPMRFYPDARYNYMINDKYSKYARNHKDPVVKRHRQRKFPRKYDRPRHPLNLEGYDVWRAVDGDFGVHPTGKDIRAKVIATPKDIIHAFGQPETAGVAELISGHYLFEDTNLDIFMLHNYKLTNTHGEKPNEDDDRIAPRYRVKSKPSPEEFWNLDEEFVFSISSTYEADFRTFRKFLQNQIQEAKNGESYDAQVEKKFGKIDFYDNYDVDYEIDNDMPINKYNKETYGEKRPTESIQEYYSKHHK